jgi:hypothetical protein
LPVHASRRSACRSTPGGFRRRRSEPPPAPAAKCIGRPGPPMCRCQGAEQAFLFNPPEAYSIVPSTEPPIPYGSLPFPTPSRGVGELLRRQEGNASSKWLRTEGYTCVTSAPAMDDGCSSFKQKRPPLEPASKLLSPFWLYPVACTPPEGLFASKAKTVTTPLRRSRSMHGTEGVMLARSELRKPCGTVGQRLLGSRWVAKV